MVGFVVVLDSKELHPLEEEALMSALTTLQRTLGIKMTIAQLPDDWQNIIKLDKV
ncbi:hypothetical protein ACFVS2_21750 [Brevibacillus sp. NPDC058079]|uniref:hypothetical protein n=1 Tax=Brevibacillus sp. NPDC058079 TaxID=3346330 RepID=UPI0036E0DD4F